eukprot:tig00020685_g12948.t1
MVEAGALGRTPTRTRLRAGGTRPRARGRQRLLRAGVVAQLLLLCVCAWRLPATLGAKPRRSPGAPAGPAAWRGAGIGAGALRRGALSALEGGAAAPPELDPSAATALLSGLVAVLAGVAPEIDWAALEQLALQLAAALAPGSPGPSPELLGALQGVLGAPLDAAALAGLDPAALPSRLLQALLEAARGLAGPAGPAALPCGLAALLPNASSGPGPGGLSPPNATAGHNGSEAACTLRGLLGAVSPLAATFLGAGAPASALWALEPACLAALFGLGPGGAGGGGAPSPALNVSLARLAETAGGAGGEGGPLLEQAGAALPLVRAALAAGGFGFQVPLEGGAFAVRVDWAEGGANCSALSPAFAVAAGGCLPAAPLLLGALGPDPVAVLGNTAAGLAGVLGALYPPLRGFAAFSFSVPNRTVVSLSTCGNGTRFDTTLALYDACPAAPGAAAGPAAPGLPGQLQAGAAIAVDDDGCGALGEGSFIASVELQAGRTYFAVVGGYDGAAGEFELRVLPGGATPLEAAEPHALRPCAPPFLGSTEDRLDLLPFWSPSGEMFFTLTVPEEQAVAVGTCSGATNFATLLHLFDRNPLEEGAAPLASSEGGCGVSRGSLLDARLAANVTYYVVVEGAVYGAAAQDPLGALLGRLHSAAHVGRFGLSVTDESCPPEPADLCGALPGADECGLGLLAGAVPPFASAAFAGASFALGLGAGAGADADPLALARPSLLYRVPAAPWARNLSVNGCTPPPHPWLLALAEGCPLGPRPAARPLALNVSAGCANGRLVYPVPAHTSLVLVVEAPCGALGCLGGPFGLTVTSSRDFCERPTLLTLLGDLIEGSLQRFSPPARPSPPPAPSRPPSPSLLPPRRPPPPAPRRPPHRRPAARPHRRPAARPHRRRACRDARPPRSPTPEPAKPSGSPGSSPTPAAAAGPTPEPTPGAIVVSFGVAAGGIAPAEFDRPAFALALALALAVSPQRVDVADVANAAAARRARAALAPPPSRSCS